MTAPYDPHDNPLEGGTKEERRQRREIASFGGGCGIFCIPLLIPLLLMIGGFLYPIAASCTLVTWYVLSEIGEGMGLVEIPLAAFSYGPAAVVMWITTRWDTWLGENFIYWLIRHVVRNIMLLVLLIIIAASEGHLPENASEAQIIRHFFSTPGALAIAAGVLAFFNFILIGKQGFLRQSWHAILDFARLRPADLDE